MATLYVEDVPEETYAALRAQARRRRTSIAAVVRELLAASLPTRAELRRRQRAFLKLKRLGWAAAAAQAPPSAETLVRSSRQELEQRSNRW